MLLTCRSIVAHLTELEEGALSPVDRLAARLHLAIPHACTRFRDQLRTTRLALAGLRAEQTASAPPPESVATAMAHFRSWRASLSKGPPPGGQG